MEVTKWLGSKVGFKRMARFGPKEHSKISRRENSQKMTIQLGLEFAVPILIEFLN